MANIKNMRMAGAVCSNPHIELSTKFIGLRTVVTYTPTNCVCEVKYYEYSVADGNRLCDILKNPEGVSDNFHPVPIVNGNYRLEICMAEDHSFLAVNPMRYSMLGYQPIGEPMVFEGDTAKILSLLFVN